MSFTPAYRVVVVVSMLLMAAGLMAMAAGCLPYSVMQPLGSWVRRPDDVTPERYQRYLIACWFLGLLSAALGALLYRSRKGAGEGLAVACRAVPNWMTAPFQYPGGWGIGVWCVILLGLGLRLMRLNEPMAYDEAYTFLNFARRPWYEAISDYNSTNNHLLNTFCMHWCYRLFGDAEASLRIPVFLAGTATLLLIYPWARLWCGQRTALVATALLAISPLMITYSVDARGYMFVTAAALALDLAAARLDRNSPGDHGGWISFTLAAIVGFWSMPIMLYAVLGTTLWFSASPFLYARGDADALQGRKQGRLRLLGLSISGAVIVMSVAAFYAPAYVFRGVRFLSDPIMVREPLSQFPAALGRSLLGAWDWLTEGGIPQPVWLVMVVAGVWWWMPSRWQRLRMLSPFLVVLTLNVLQRAAPPPRIYLFLFPWVAILAAHGGLQISDRLLSLVVRGARRRETPGLSQCGLTLAVCVAGGWYAVSRPVLFNVAERRSFLSIRDAMSRLSDEQRASPEVRRRLFAPLPCDLPALFYSEREQLRLEVNGEPEAGEELWLVTRLEESPAAVLTSALVQQPELATPPERWAEVETLQTLRLYQDDRTDHESEKK